MHIVGSHGFRARDVLVASTPWARLRGLMATEPRPVFLATSSVHGFWLRAPLHAVAIGDRGDVIAVTLLRRRRFVTVPASRGILELPLDHPLPAASERLTFVWERGEAGDDGRTPLFVCHPDR